jgi:hypothetical protein
MFIEWEGEIAPRPSKCQDTKLIADMITAYNREQSFMLDSNPGTRQASPPNPDLPTGPSR